MLGAKQRAESHGENGELPHHGLVDLLVRKDVLARRVINDKRGIRDDRGKPFVVDRIYFIAAPADAYRPE